MSYLQHMKAQMLWASVITIGVSVAASAGDKADASAMLRTGDGELVGTAVFKEARTGVLIKLKLEGLPEGKHAFHIHETGDCSPLIANATDDKHIFSSAGSHLSTESNKHGLLDENRPHEGDMPNIVVNDEGAVELKIFNGRVSLNADGSRAPLLDGDGSAVVIHQGADDYATDPAGAAGARIACGVIMAN